MKLRQKTLLIVNMTLLGLIGVLYVASSTILMGNIRKAEENEAKQTVKGVEGLLIQTQENFSDRFSDWSAWDDTYIFIQDANKNYIQSNLVIGQLSNLKTDLMLYVNNSGQIIYGTGFDPQNKIYKPLPEKLRRIPADDLLLKRPDLNSKLTGIMLLPETPMWVTAQPILDSNAKKPIKGTLIVGRNLDKKAIDQLARISRLPITVYRADDNRIPAEFQAIRANLSAQQPVLVQPISEEVIGGYTLINDVYGKPALILRVDIPRRTYQQGKKSLHYLILALLIAGIVFAGVVLLLLEKSILLRLAGLTHGVSCIRDSGDLSLRLSVSGKDEIYTLSSTTNKMLEALETSQAQLKSTLKQLGQANEEITVLNERLKSENLRLSAEIEITRQLQKMILPKEQELSQIDGLEIAGYMEPAEEVGGDYYDVLTSDGRVKIAIGDVTGHGLESGVIMLMVQTAVRTLLTNQETDPIKFLNTVNRTIYDNVQRMNSDKSLSLCLLEYNNQNLSLSGQHEEIIVVRSGGSYERIDTIDLGFPIALEPDIKDFVMEANVHLNPGDIVILYSDGITEAEDINGLQYGLERLCEVASTNWQNSAAEVRQAVIKDVQQHIGKQKVYDDITLLILKQK